MEGMSRRNGGRSAQAVPGGSRMALRPEGGLRGLRRDWPQRGRRHLEVSNRFQAMIQPMNENYDRLKLVTPAVVAHIELCGMCCFGKSTGRGAMVGPSGAAGRGG